MSYQDVLSFVSQNPVFSIATIDDDQPRVRAFLTVLFDDGRIYFTTGATKDFYRQVNANSRVELCYCTADFSRMLRITGVVEEVDDRAKKQQLIDERDYLKGLSADDPVFKLMCIPHGQARFWTLADNMRERDLLAIEF